MKRSCANDPLNRSGTDRSHTEWSYLQSSQGSLSPLHRGNLVVLVPVVRVVRCAPKSYSCPHCGLHRRLGSLAYRRVAYLDVHYAEYQSRCHCFRFFRIWPLGVKN
jgi:hypothetical protein